MGSERYACSIKRSVRAHVLLEMAGNIIPAIATTNAIIAGLIVLQALHLLRRSKSANKVTSAVATPNTSPTKIIAANPNSPLRTLRNINIQSKSSVPLSASRPVPPNPKCAVCRDTYTQIRCDPTLTSLSELVDGVMGDGEENGGTGPRDVSVFEGNRLLADPDFDDNLAKPLSALGIGYGKFVTIVDEDKEWNNLSVAISRLP
jgi:ubiquitin-like 1-activating enzyme E1 B